jgi:hypothetical protein
MSMVSIKDIHAVYNQTVIFVCETQLARPDWNDEQIIAYAMEDRDTPSAFQEMHLRDALSLMHELVDLGNRRELFQQNQTASGTCK